jgi:hypothetical protein
MQLDALVPTAAWARGVKLVEEPTNPAVLEKTSIVVV